jgi:hypothetical protein
LKKKYQVIIYHKNHLWNYKFKIKIPKDYYENPVSIEEWHAVSLIFHNELMGKEKYAK